MQLMFEEDGCAEILVIADEKPSTVTLTVEVTVKEAEEIQKVFSAWDSWQRELYKRMGFTTYPVDESSPYFNPDRITE